MAHTYDEFKIRDGKILLYRRSDSGDNWHCRIKFPSKPYIRRSLKTDSREEAKQLAEEIFAELNYKSKRGLAVTSRKFRAVAKSFVEQLDARVAKDTINDKRAHDYKLVIDRYLIPYFGKKSIDNISDADVERYREWRKVYWISGEGSKAEFIEYERGGKLIRSPKRKPKLPSNNTLNKEDSVLRQIFQHGRVHGFITQEEIPIIKNQPVKKNRRPAFDVKEYRRLIRVAYWRYKKAPDENVAARRRLLHEYVLFMVNAGTRPIEAATLRWRDVETFTAKNSEGEQQEYIKISVRGKAKKRTCVPMPRIAVYLERIKAAQIEHGKQNDFTVEPDDLVFRDRYGKSVKSFKKGFDELLEASGLTYDNHNLKRSIYSLRHTYATFRLIYGGVNVYDLAENMGTSVQMIEKHYGHLKPEDVAERLTRVVM
ncbi:hypothetical protein BOW53_04220 [Solemya pervernicosa gill symbiont]|uniref:Tyr recombinase domain-containing protein n=1 Tax=Solemya pervernicosa gill symbiont TaxID=642797 RepID=A0A1T2L8A0_9GAMM|nr:tyrosine-type recombinase/integrase [Solemya pervernicosa gill symbiont]OOZ41329.1 hypothetical protein BOW53_04220 [Solemya pervernicosa gill symbiont]